MSFILGILALIGVAGAGIALYERRSKHVLMAHDLSKDTRTGVRAQDHPMNLTLHPSQGGQIF